MKKFKASSTFIEEMAVHIDSLVEQVYIDKKSGTYSRKLREYLAKKCNEVIGLESSNNQNNKEPIYNFIDSLIKNGFKEHRVSLPVPNTILIISKNYEISGKRLDGNVYLEVHVFIKEQIIFLYGDEKIFEDFKSLLK